MSSLNKCVVFSLTDLGTLKYDLKTSGMLSFLPLQNNSVT